MAPFAGITGLTDISVGDLVSNATEITTLDDLSTLRVDFEVPERWAERIAQDQAIEATAQALPGAEFPGRITGIDNRIDETTRTLRLEAELANEGQALKTGMAVTVELHFESDSQLAVPTLAVQWDRRGSFVWKIAEGAARRADVTIIRRQSGMVIVRGRPCGGRHGRRRGHPAAARGRAGRGGEPGAGDGRRCAGRGRRAGQRDAPSASGEPAQHAELDAMALHFDDARARLSEATKGISALCVRRPVLTIVFNLLIVVAGLAAFRGVEIRELPDIDRPVITVRATYDGATPGDDRQAGHRHPRKRRRRACRA